MCGSGSRHCIIVRIIGVEVSRRYFGDDGKRAWMAMSFSSRSTCFWDGCGSSVDEAHCLDRTVTGIVVLVVARGGSARTEVLEVGSMGCSVVEVGLRGSLCEPEV